VTLEGQIAANELSIISAVTISLATTAVTIALTVLLGTPLAYFA
jgi:ABC-type sulfate transport system permease component